MIINGVIYSCRGRIGKKPFCSNTLYVNISIEKKRNKKKKFILTSSFFLPIAEILREIFSIVENVLSRSIAFARRPSEKKNE